MLTNLIPRLSTDKEEGDKPLSVKDHLSEHSSEKSSPAEEPKEELPRST
jgi:hypothetical protein